MMIRNAFNGGEISPNAALRCDLDVYHRGASMIENFDVGQAGGLTRRRGFRRVIEALAGSKIFGYVYSVDVSYLVEINDELIRVIDAVGNIVFSAPSVWGLGSVDRMSTRQINSLLMICSSEQKPHVLSFDGVVWEFKEFELKVPPRREKGLRDHYVDLTQEGSNIKMSFGEGASDVAAQVGDKVCVEVRIPQQSDLLLNPQDAGYRITGISSSITILKNAIFTIVDGNVINWWTCIKGFGGANDFVSGRTSPSDYPEFFSKGLAKSPVFTCRGSWKFSCSGTWYGEYAVERRYKDTDPWESLGESLSPEESARNEVLTGDESDEECYLRLMLYHSFSGKDHPTKNKLIVSSYVREAWFEVSSAWQGATIASMKVGSYLNGFIQTYNILELGQSGSVSAVYKDNVLLPGVTGTVYRDANGVWFNPSGMEASLLGEGVTGVYSGDYKIVFRTNANYKLYNGSVYYNVYTPNKLSVKRGDNFGNTTNYAIEATHQKTGERMMITPGAYGITNVDPDYGLNVMSKSTTNLLVDLNGSDQPGHILASCFYQVVMDGKAGVIMKDISAIKEHFPVSYRSYYWSWEAWRQAYGYPSRAEVLSQRLVFSATKAQPQTIWMSKTDDLNHFGVSDKDDGALSVTLSTTTQNAVAWIMAQNNKLLVGTEDGEWVIDGSSGVITPTDVRAGTHGFVGSQENMAMVSTDKCLYIERGGGRLWQYGYDYESDGYLSRDMTVFADHVLAQGGGVVQMALQRKPDARLLIVLNDGSMALMTYNTQHQVNAWHRYISDKHNETGEPCAKMKSVVCLPNGNNNDRIFVIMDRYGDRYIEVIDEESEWMDPEGHFYESIVVLNDMDVMESLGEKRQSAKMMMYLGRSVDASRVKVSNDGKTWTGLDRTGDLGCGWHDLVTVSKMTREVRIGVKVESGAEFILRAIKG